MSSTVDFIFTATRPIPPSVDRGTAEGITNDDFLCTITELLKQARVKIGEVHDDDVEKGMNMTSNLVKQNYNDDKVLEMHTCYQNLWSTFLVAETAQNNYSDVKLVNFF